MEGTRPDRGDAPPVAPAPPLIEVDESDWPLAALGGAAGAPDGLGRDVSAGTAPGALALITGVEGAAYRPPGAAMAIDPDGGCSGSLSSGCLERDVALHGLRVMRDGAVRRLRYGRGSPFVDITLPCGGGLDIAVVPAPPAPTLALIRAELTARRPVQLLLAADGTLELDPAATATEAPPAIARLRLHPQDRFVIFGKGPEAAHFARITRQAGYPAELFADEATAQQAGFGQPLPVGPWPTGLTLDPYAAVTLFFHDHALEPELLAQALASPAFYVGAQGSLRAHQARCAALAGMGVPASRIAALASPFGLIPSTRDPRTLAVSVLAQVLDRAARR